MAISSDNVRIAITLSKEDKRLIEAMAKFEKRSVSQQISYVLGKYLAEQQASIRFPQSVNDMTTSSTPKKSTTKAGTPVSKAQGKGTIRTAHIGTSKK
ncbi:hypothetical protein [Listeria monocytogenes]|uniref:hypothetical protein n=1 Tax=Listeria monocytogenes TaxID=1639 RepID=UPI001E2F1F59|nr:hypothetical protein [Listeria monocytogenes]MCD2223035.1 hypothetical protein [Listeria monocytogenes]